MNQLKKLCDELMSTSSKNAKTSIITRNKDNQLFTDVLYFLFNTYITTGLSTKKINKNVGVINGVNYVDCLTSELYPLGDIRNLLEYIKANNTGRDYDISMCESYFTNFEPDMQSFIKSILTKSLKLGFDSKTVNKVMGKGFIPEHEVQQAYSIDKYNLKKEEWFSLSEKMNGIRGSYVDGKFLSRQGLEIEGLDHIINEIETIGLADSFIDGELIRINSDGIPDNENFRLTTSIINSDSSDKSGIKFVIFDFMPAHEFENGESKLTYKDRLNLLYDLKDNIQMTDLDHIEVVDLIYAGTDQSKIELYLNEMVAKDKEGLMLNRDMVYKCKRHNGILKIKRFYTMDLPVIGFEKGTGRLSDTLGAFVVDFKGNKVNVGSGFSDEQRNDFWNNREDLIGRIVEVKYKEISSDKSGVQSLQFPTFVDIREVGKKVSYN